MKASSWRVDRDAYVCVFVLLCFVFANVVLPRVAAGQDAPLVFQYEPVNYETVPYEAPKGRVTIDGMLLFRDGVGEDQSLVFDDSSGFSEPVLSTGDFEFKNEFAGQVNVEFGSFHLGYFGSGELEESFTRESPSTNVQFFNAAAAEERQRYTANYRSYLNLGDIGLRKEFGRFTSIYASGAIGRLKEDLNLVGESTVSADPSDPNAAPNPPGSLTSEVENNLYGVNLGARRQLFNNGNLRLEITGVAGAYFNDMEVNATSANHQGKWNDSDIAYSGVANASLVIPAWPVNFRVGYQAVWLSGVAIAPEASRTLDIIGNGGDISTNDVLYHGLIIGVEKLW